MADPRDDARAKAEATFKKKDDHRTEEAQKARGEQAAAEKAADAKRAGLKSLRLAQAAQQETSKRRSKSKS